MTDTLCASVRVNFVNFFALINGIVRTHWLANITIDAFVRYQQRHGDLTFPELPVQGVEHMGRHKTGDIATHGGHFAQQGR